MIPPHQHTELTKAVRRAGEVLLSLWPGEKGSRDALRTEKKADGSVVTQADLQSNEILIEALTRLFPNDAILSEETPFSPSHLESSRRTWIIDPLDGTRSFVHGADDFSILVALCQDFVPVYAIMFFPARQQFVTAQQGTKPFCNNVALAVSQSKTPRLGRVYIRNFECQRPELAAPMMDSGAALLKVAAGELDGAIIRMTTHREWDIAAPAAVIEAAGGRVSAETLSQIRFGRGLVDYQYLIASNGHIHQQLQAVI